MEATAWFASIGFECSTPELDGKVHRIDRQGSRGKPCWYIGWSDPFTVIVAGDWRTDEKFELKEHANLKLSRDDKKRLTERIKAAQAEAEAERERVRQAVSLEADIVLRSAAPFGSHAYLERKHVGAYGVGFDGGDLLVPVRDMAGRTWGYQRITTDGKKLFVAGQRVAGCFHRIGEPDDRVFICEGYATGASIHMATGKAVFCAFNAGNLRDVARQVRERYPAIAITVAGDDDQFTAGNPGRTKGDEAAVVALAAACYPAFQNLDGKPTDWNDLAVREGLPVVRAQLDAVATLEKSYVPLGFDEQTYYVYSFKTRTVMRFSSFAKSQFYGLARRDYWEARYPMPRGKDDLIDWERAKDDLITACQAVGPFDATRVRGSGVWLDRQRVIVNTSAEIVVDNVAIPITRLSTSYVYCSTRNSLTRPPADPLSLDDCRILVEAARRFRWKHPKYAPYLAGWLVIARVAGALPIRPHVWLTGGSGTGKSTCLDRLIRPALGAEGSCLYAQGGTTEAGLRQIVKADSLPVVFDEFETTGIETRARVAAIVELLRQSWSYTSGAIAKGSAGGTATLYQLAFAALVSSIRVTLDNDADRSRFSVLELAPHDGDRQHWRDLDAVLALITPDYGERLFARSIAKLPAIRENFRTFKEVLAPMGQRFADQHGMLLAGFATLLADEPMSRHDAEGVAATLDLEEDKGEIAPDHEDCYTSILTTKITIPMARNAVDGATGSKAPAQRVDMAIGDVIESADPDQVDSLRTYGIVVDADYVHVACKFDALRRTVFAGTRWAVGWSKSLARIPGAKETQRKFAGKNHKCIAVPRTPRT